MILWHQDFLFGQLYVNPIQDTHKHNQSSSYYALPDGCVEYGIVHLEDHLQALLL